LNSDGDTPEKQAEQIMAIYPILPGQVSKERDIPPPHSHTAEKASSDDKGGDLIDFGQSDDPAPAQPVGQPVGQSSSDIPNLLEATGQKVDGPLVDFTGDLKKDLPADKAKAPPGVTRAESGESNDDFFDAEE
jgi:oxysterol-binding protein-related protein 8